MPCMIAQPPVVQHHTIPLHLQCKQPDAHQTRTPTLVPFSLATVFPSEHPDGEEIEVAPADADDFIMEAADVAVFDEEEWV